MLQRVRERESQREEEVRDYVPLDTVMGRRHTMPALSAIPNAHSEAYAVSRTPQPLDQAQAQVRPAEITAACHALQSANQAMSQEALRLAEELRQMERELRDLEQANPLSSFSMAFMCLGRRPEFNSLSLLT